jgi:hypothetical protein
MFKIKISGAANLSSYDAAPLCPSGLTGMAVTLQTCIQEAHGLNRDKSTIYTDRFFMVFSVFLGDSSFSRMTLLHAVS